MSLVSLDAKLHALIEIYNNDREEERQQTTRRQNMFISFMLLFIGAANALLQAGQATDVWINLIFFVSVNLASLLYWGLDADMYRRIRDAALIKEGREVLIKMLINQREATDYESNFLSNMVDRFSENVKSPDYPFLNFHETTALKIKPGGIYRRFLVGGVGLVVSLAPFGYSAIQGTPLELGLPL